MISLHFAFSCYNTIARRCNLYKIICCLFIILYSTCAFAVSDSSIRRYAFNVPDKITDNIRNLTKYLIKPYDNDYDKLKSIAYWIASNIAYDGYKYDGKVNRKMLKYKYDVLKAKAGICTDFAKLFAEMADIANIKNVEIVHGYVINTDKYKKKYSKKMIPSVGHAWNKVTLGRRAFYVDTTFMSSQKIGNNERRKSAYKHKIEIKKRDRYSTDVNGNIDDFFFDFEPKSEVENRRKHHLREEFL